MPVYLGIDTDNDGFYNPGGIPDVESAIGRTFNMQRVFNDYNAHLSIPQNARTIHVSSNARESRDVPHFTWSQVANGAMDGFLDNWGDDLASYISTMNRDIWFTWYHEPSNPHNFPQTGTALDFCRSWRHVIQRIKARPGTGRVKFVWTMQAGKFKNSDPNAWYPGDDVVDIVGADAYLWAMCSTWAGWKQCFDPTGSVGASQGYDYAQSTNAPGNSVGGQKKQSKPLAFPEFGLLEDSPSAWYTHPPVENQTCRGDDKSGQNPDDPKRKGDYIRNVLSGIRTRLNATPGSILALEWFNQQHGDNIHYWHIKTSADAIAAFTELGNDTIFGGNNDGGGGGGGGGSVTGLHTAAWLTGFESGATSFNTYAAIVGSVGVSTTAAEVRTGTYGLLADGTTTAAYVERQLDTAQQWCSGRIYFRIRTAGTASHTITQVKGVAGPQAQFRYYQPSDTVGFRWGTTATPTLKSGTISHDVWHRLDFRVNMATRAIDWYVDGSKQTQVTDAAAADNVNRWQLGIDQNAIGAKVAYDDCSIGYLKADHPYGDATIFAKKANGMGINSQGNGTFLRETNAAIGSGDWSRIDEVPMTSVADFVKQTVADTAGYVVVQFEDVTEAGTPTSVVCHVAYHAGTAAIVNGTTKIIDGTAESIIYSGTHAGVGNKVASGIVTPGGGWTSTIANGLKGQFGFSSDCDATKFLALDAMMLEVEMVTGGAEIEGEAVGACITGSSIIGTLGGTGHAIGGAITGGTASGDTRIRPKQQPPRPEMLGPIIHQVSNSHGTFNFTAGDWTAEEDSPGGYGPCSMKVSRAMYHANFDVLQAGSQLTAYDVRSGDVVWAGELLTPAISAGIVQLSGRGYAHIFDQQTQRLLYENNDSDAWDTMDSAPYNNGNGYKAYESYDISVNNGGIVFKCNKGDKFPNAKKAGFIFWAEGVNLAQIAFILNKSDDTNDFTLLIQKAIGPGGGLTLVDTIPLTATNGDGSEIVRNLGRDSDMIRIIINKGSAGDITSLTDTLKFVLTNIRVWGDADTSGTVSEDESFSSSQVISDLAGRTNVNDSHVHQSPDNVLPLDFEDSTFTEAADWVAIFADWSWTIRDENGPSLWYEPWDEVVWVLNDPEMKLDLVPLERFNYLRLAYKRNNGRSGNVTVKANPDPLEKPTYYTDLQLPNSFPNSDLARDVGQELINYLSTERYGGTLSLTEVMDEHSNIVPATLIHAGHSLYVPQRNVTLRISHIERSDKEVQVTFDDRLALIDSLLERKRMRLGGSSQP